MSEEDELRREFYSILADRAYDRREDLHPDIEKLPYDQYDDMANVYKLDDNVIIAYKGTTPSNLSDLRADLMLGVGIQDIDPKFRRALNLFSEVRKDYPTDQLTTTGHSLGGELSSFTSLYNEDTHAYTFNKGAGFVDRSSPRSTGWITGDDSISKMSQFQKFGRVITHNPKPDRLKVPILNLVDRHSMNNFLPESEGGYNPDLNINLERRDFLKLKKEIIPQSEGDISRETIQPEIPPEITSSTKRFKEDISKFKTPVKTSPKLSLNQVLNLYPNESRSKIIELFLKADINKDNYLDPDELKLFVSNL